MMSKLYYDVRERYFNLGKKTIGHILEHFTDYKYNYLLEHENEAPSLIGGCRSWLESKSQNKKVWVLQYNTELSEFTNK